MSQPQSRKSSPEEAKAQQPMQDSPPFSLEQVRDLRTLFREPGWKVFSLYREAMRRLVEASLHNEDMADPTRFALRQAGALGQHNIQKRYERMEQEFEYMLEALIQQKEQITNAGV